MKYEINLACPDRNEQHTVVALAGIMSMKLRAVSYIVDTRDST